MVTMEPLVLASDYIPVANRDPNIKEGNSSTNS
jgi:hypothetical protein